MKSALDSKARPAVQPEANWVSLLEISAREVFQIMLQTELTNLLNMQNLSVAGDVTAMVGLAGALCGVLYIRCNSRTAEKITSRMLGSVGAVDPQDVPDAVAEICNMVAGNFKSKLSSLSEHCLLSVPMVIRGDDYEMVTVPVDDEIMIGMEYDAEPIWFVLAVHT